MKYLLGPLFLISALIFACGGSGGGKALSDEDAVRKVVNDFESVFNSNNPASGYNLLSADSQKGCKQSDFVGIITFAKAFLGNQKITVATKDVKISGNTAIATTVSSLDGEPQDPSDVSLVKESGNWRIVLDSADCSLSGSADSSNPPGTPTKVPTPPSVKSKRTSTSPVSATSGGVKITIQSVQVADFQEYLAAVDSNTRQDINFASESKGAITIGLMQVKIENNTSSKIQLSPRDSTVVVGSEQEPTASFLGDDDLDGDYFPGVFKEGTIYFFLKRIKPADVASILVAIDAAYDSSTYNSLGDEFQLKVTF